MATNDKSFNYGLPNRFPKLPKKFPLIKKSKISKYASKSFDLCNPVPVTYQRNAFQPSTVSKVIDIPKRLIDGFVDPDSLENQPQRQIILHTGRYAFINNTQVHKNQNERLLAEEDYLKKVKFLKKMSDSRLRMRSQNLILEGENLLSSHQVEKQEPLPFSQNKVKHFFSNIDSLSDLIPPAPTVIETSRMMEREFEFPDSSQPVSMAVQRIRLKDRNTGLETMSSAPVTSDLRSQGNMNLFRQSSSLRFAREKLPPIDNINRQSDSAFNSHFDYEAAYQQSERFNRPYGRINEYIMGGIPVKFSERYDIQGELQYLKSIILPVKARELYVGRGIQLPSNHATKIPRGKYLDDNLVGKSVINSELKIFTPGGGSLTINTTTPNDGESTQENQVNFIKPSTPEKLQSLEVQKLNTNEIFENLCNNTDKDTDGFMESQTVKRIILENSNLSVNWKEFLTTVLDSLNLINENQLKIILETLDYNLKFSVDFPVFEIADAKIFVPVLLNETFQSEDLFTNDQIIHLIGNSSQISLTKQQIDESYEEFLHSISQTEISSHENIQKHHLLLFVPYLLKSFLNKK